MRIVINVDQVHDANGKRKLRIRTRYNRNDRDRDRMGPTAQNAVLDLYNQLVVSIRNGADDSITELIDEGEQ